MCGVVNMYKMCKHKPGFFSFTNLDFHFINYPVALSFMECLVAYYQSDKIQFS